MFEFLKKKKNNREKTAESHTEYSGADNEKLPDIIAENELPEKDGNSLTAFSFDDEKESGADKTPDEYDFFAELLGETVEELKDEIRLHEIKRFSEKLCKLTVRYGLTDAEALITIENCYKLSLSEIIASPAYLKTYALAVKKSGIYGQRICALIDFPFGESNFKSKITDVKSSLKYGVDGFTVVMPAICVKNTGEFRSEIRKIGKVSGKNTGVAFSASELDAEKIKLIFKTAEKSEISSITFAFGDETEAEIKSKCELIRKNKGKKEVRILGNVKSAEAVAKICSLGADKVVTPYADEIAAELIRRFNVKSVKLI